MTKGGDDRVGVLSQTAIYALRATATLAGAAGGEPTRATELAERTGVPLPYLSKVLRKLVAHGVLVAQRGHGGGFSLARAPSRIRVLDVLAAVDEMPAPSRCAFGWGRCDPVSPCPLHPAWSELLDAFRGWAMRVTLADVAATA